MILSALALSHTLQMRLERRFLDSPTYLSDALARVTVSAPPSAPAPQRPRLVLRALDAWGGVVASMAEALNADETRRCFPAEGARDCPLAPRLLPLQALSAACTVEAWLEDAGVGALSEKAVAEGGNCAAPPLGTGDALMAPDLHLGESLAITEWPAAPSPYPRPPRRGLAVTVGNRGAYGVLRPLWVKAAAYGVGDEPIWSDVAFLADGAGRGDAVTAAFAAQITEAQFQRLCRVKVAVDPAAREADALRSDNEREYTVGACRPDPARDGQSLPDLVGWAEFSPATGLVVHAVNLGAAPAPAFGLPVAYQVDLFDAQGAPVWSFASALGGMMEPLGGEATATLPWSPVIAAACEVRLAIDADGRQPESDRTNNFYVLNFCQGRTL